ncbi:MAG: hypothetical protein QNJ40_20690 [Xanthomonadales bacterium]|nr:hypothetical protein [Xanthomonadales bacterium]
MSTFSSNRQRRGAASTEFAIGRLTRAGMSALGARQALSGQMILDPNDRAFVAGMINTALMGKGHVNYDWVLEEG